MWLIELSTNGFKLNRKGWFPDPTQRAGSFGQRCDTGRALARAILADRRYGYLLRVTNPAFRYLLVCEATESNAEKPAFTALEHPFRELGCRRTSVPTTAFRSLPKVCSTSPRVSVLWLRLGLALNSLNPGIPSRTVAMNAGSRSPPAPISYTSGPSSTISSKSSTILGFVFCSPG